MSQELKRLFSPIKIGQMTVRNRIVSSPHYPMGYVGPTGLPTPRLVNYWAAKARAVSG